MRESVRCRIVSVTSNEAINATDWKITGDLTLNLRAERSNRGTGRIYDHDRVCGCVWERVDEDCDGDGAPR